MAKTIVVTSNCQTFGIAAALAAIYPTDVVVPHHRLKPSDNLPDCDVVVADARNPDGNQWIDRAPRPAQVIRFSRIRFAGFHPDLCFLRRRSTGDTAGEYRSAIALWAYANGLTIADAEGLFCDEIYKALGYYDCFENSVSKLKDDFRDTDVSFDRLYLSIKRKGVFMHTYNHPKVSALVCLARLIAEKIGPEGAYLGADEAIADGLSSHIWPVYPEIAADLAVEGGSYDWGGLGREPARGVRAYLEDAFADCERRYIDRDDVDLLLVSGIARETYDRVLGSSCR